MSNSAFSVSSATDSKDSDNSSSGHAGRSNGLSVQAKFDDIRRPPAFISFIPFFLSFCSPAFGIGTSPFSVAGIATTEIYRSGSTNPLMSSSRDFIMWNSNEVWQIQLKGAGGSTANCKRIPEGIRYFNAFGNADPNALNSAETFRQSYPPPGNWDMVACWMAFKPDAELPVLDATTIRRLQMPELASHPKNRGRYSLERRGNSPALIRSLLIFSDGTRFDSNLKPLDSPPPFDKGYLELSFSSLESRNWNGLDMPLFAELKIFNPSLDAQSSNDVHLAIRVRLETQKLFKQGDSDFPNPDLPKQLMAYDGRRFGKTNQDSVYYVVTNDVWQSTNSESLQNLVASPRELAKRNWAKASAPKSSPRGAIILPALVAASVPLFFFLKTRKR